MGPWRRLLYRWARRNQARVDRQGESPEEVRSGCLGAGLLVFGVVSGLASVIRHARSGNWLFAVFLGAGVLFSLLLLAFMTSAWAIARRRR